MMRRDFLKLIVAICAATSLIVFLMGIQLGIDNGGSTRFRSTDIFSEKLQTLRRWQSSLYVIRKGKKTFYPTYIRANFTLNSPKLCGNGQNVSLLFWVQSAASHHLKRQYIRSTFANGSYFKNHVVKVMFLVGKVADPHVTRNVSAEHRKYGDVIEGDFHDAYRNLTLKVVMGLSWIAQYCKHASLIAKIDDDVFVNTFRILNLLDKEHANMKRTIYGGCFPDYGMMIMRTEKWKLHKDQLKLYSYYPWGYCSGYGTLITGDLVPLLYKAATFSPFFWVDDAYLSGVLFSKIAGARHAIINATYMPDLVHSCFKTANCKYYFGLMEPKYFPEIWQKMVKNKHGQLDS